MDKQSIEESVEKLLDVSSIKPLVELIPGDISSNYKIPGTEGVYAFWLKNSNDIAQGLHREVSFLGPNVQEYDQMKYDVTWSWNLDDSHVLLYVGKSTNIKNRVGLHLKLGTSSARWTELKSQHQRDRRFMFKPTTSCQVRAGLEHLLLDIPDADALDFIRQNIGFTYLEEKEFAKRFFVEDLAIGIGRPWFNLDSER